MPISQHCLVASRFKKQAWAGLSVCLLAATLGLSPGIGSAFSVGYYKGVAVPTGEVHQDMTREALRRVTIDTVEFGRLEFNADVIDIIAIANQDVDKFQDNPEFHFDNELKNASRHILDLKKIILDSLNSPRAMTPLRAAGIHYQIGRALHTVQDFYSHSNWVNNNSTFNQEIGRIELVDFSGDACRPFPFTNILVTQALITGDTSNLLTAYAPPGKCAHGGEFNGIHKDWATRFDHGVARAQAVEATIDFVKNQILEAATNKQSVCRVMSIVDCSRRAKDIWTTSVYSYAPGGGGPGGGLDDDVLRVGGWGDFYHSLLQFDLTGRPAQASSVILRLYNGLYNPGNGPTPMTLHRIAQFWDWRTQGTGLDRLRLWWADRPPTIPMGPTALRPAILPAPVMDAFYDIDVTDLYNFWQSNPSENFGLELRPTLNNNNWNFFSSFDYSGNPAQRPQLIITQ